MNADEINQLKAICLDKALNPDFEFVYRRICRWYSKEFSTPLHMVEGMPTETVLRHYFENWFDGLATSQSPEAVKEIENLKLQMSGTTKHVDEDEEWEEAMLRDIAEEEAKKSNRDAPKPAAAPPSDPPNLEEIEENFERSFDDSYEG